MSDAPFNSRFDPAMTMTEFLANEYIPAAGRRRRTKREPGKPLSVRRREQLDMFARRLKAYLQREPLVGDLNPETLAAFREWHRECWLVAPRWLAIDCLAMLRFCKLVPDGRQRCGRKKRPLSGEPGTLWHICAGEYFAKSLRIRDDKTRLGYRIAMADFAESLGREPMPADLSDDNLIAMMVWMQNAKRPDGTKRLATKTINERAGRIKALWNWLAKRRIVDQFPATPRLPEPRRLPRAWSDEELARLFASCRAEIGYVVNGVLSSDWWSGLHWFLWSTGERIGAILACRWEWLDWQTGYLQIDAEFRKGKDADFLHKLRPECLEILARIKPAGHDLIFPWPWSETTFYSHYNGILRRAGLMHDRKSKFHKMRRSVASHLQAAGVDACAALGHSSPDVTRKSYLDPRIVAPRSVADVLFNPDDVAHPAIATLPAVPRLLTYREGGAA